MPGAERDQQIRFLIDSSYQSNTLREAFGNKGFQRQEDEGAMLTPTDNSQLPAIDRSHGEEIQTDSEDGQRTAYERLEQAFLDELNKIDGGDFPQIEFSGGDDLPEPLVAGRIYGRILYPIYEKLRSKLKLPRLEPKEVVVQMGQPTLYTATYVATTAVFNYLHDTGKLVYAQDDELFLRQMRGIPSFLNMLQEGISTEFGLPYPPLYVLPEEGSLEY